MAAVPCDCNGQCRVEGHGHCHDLLRHLMDVGGAVIDGKHQDMALCKAKLHGILEQDGLPA